MNLNSILIGSENPQGLADFYTKLFGWTTKDWDMGPAGIYKMFYAGEQALGGIAPLGGEQPVPSHWVCYVSVRSVDAAVERALALGGGVRMPGTDIPDVGRFAMITDQAGAVIAPFTPKPGSEMPESADYPVGTFCWYELLAKDVATAAHFYTQVFGWTHRPEDMGQFGTYHLFRRGDQDIAGMMPKPADAAGPSQWLPYVRVGDVDASAARFAELGGTVHVSPLDIPNVGRFAVGADPTGAMIALYKPK